METLHKKRVAKNQNKISDLYCVEIFLIFYNSIFCLRFTIYNPLK